MATDGADTDSPNKDAPEVATATTEDKPQEKQNTTAGLESTDEVSKESKSNSPDPEPEPEPEYPTFWKLIIIILGLYLAILLVALDQTIIGTAIPKITDQFQSIEDVGWYGSAYFLTSTALQPSFGRIYRIFNVRSCLE